MYGKCILGEVMNKWLFSVVGVVFLSILFDIIYPSGKTNKFCKSIFGIIAIVVIVSPILNIADVNWDKTYVDETLSNNIIESKEEVLAIQIKEYLKNKGIDGLDVEVRGTLSENDFEIENIYIDTTNIVLIEDKANINKYEVIVSEVSNKFDVSEDMIFLYG